MFVVFVEIDLKMAERGISLQDLIDRFHLSQDQLNEEVSTEHLREVFKNIEDHEIVGLELGLTSAEMNTITSSDVNKPELQKLKMLRKWKQKYSWKATYRKFIEGLIKCSRGDHARDVCELLTKRKYHN